jgi:hypothetical protein
VELIDFNFNELQRKYDGFGGAEREDLADNLEDHLTTEINAFAEETGLSFGQSLNLFSPLGEEHEDGARPRDAVLDCMAYRGIRTISQDGIPASPVCEVFDSNDGNFALGIGFVQNLFGRSIGAGVDSEVDLSREYMDEMKQVADQAGNYRSSLPRPFNPENTGEMEMRRNYNPRVRIADVIAVRKTIIGDQYEAPIVEEPKNTKLRPVGDGNLPRYKMTTSKEVTRTSEIGYELELTDKLRRSQRITIDAITEVQLAKARQTENAIVNHFLDMIGKDAQTIDFGAGPLDRNDIIHMHLIPDDDYMITTIIGELELIAQYAGADIFYTSNNQAMVTPSRRNFVDAILGNEFIAKKNRADVTELAVTSKRAGIAFDRRSTLDYIVEQRGTVQETYRANRERSTVIANSHNFAGRLKTEASSGDTARRNTRWKITINV